MRKKILNFIVEKIAGIKVGQKIPAWARIMIYILFPIKSIMRKINSSNNFSYDFISDTYHINGLDFSWKFFSAFDGLHGRCFQIIKTDKGIVTVETIDVVNMIKANKIRNAHEVHGRDGSWDENEYMCGLFNGMEYALSVIEDREPKYRTVPEMGIRDEKGTAGEICVMKRKEEDKGAN